MQETEFSEQNKRQKQIRMKIEMIVAADNNWAIGKNNKLLISIPRDMQFFQNETTGNVVVMGRKTLESLPGKLPLKSRENIILTRDTSYKVKGAITVHSVEELMEVLENYPDRKVYVVGGGEIYRLLLPYADVVHVTRIFTAYDADTYFPNLDEDEEWVLAEQSEEQTYFNLEYEFHKYIRKK